jgi:pyrroloquinoline quinone biosynthesis protein E
MTTYRPLVLLAELIYSCPLHCPYCSNPTAYPTGQDLTGKEWARVFREATAMGVLHVGLSGGEPLLRPDLGLIIAAARSAGLYSNLITSAVGLSQPRILELKAAGLDSIQISFQSDAPDLADRIAGSRAHHLKLQAAVAVREAGLPLSLNVVLHQANIERLPQIIDLAAELGAKRLELANVQYYGWAFKNQANLLPTRQQTESAQQTALAAKERLKEQMEILYVLPDYHQDRPKPCMQGWGQRYLTVNPIGQVLPCPNAFGIPNLSLENVRARSLSDIWLNSDSFNRFRGTEWMPEPCQSCPQREIDFGGCRCQAALLTGDARNTDPVCSLSPQHDVVQRLTAELIPTLDWEKRINPSA